MRKHESQESTTLSYRRRRGNRGVARFPSKITSSPTLPPKTPTMPPPTGPITSPPTPPPASPTMPPPTPSPTPPPTAPPVVPSYRFVQVGQTLCGIQDDSIFGQSVSISEQGNMVAIGANQYNGTNGDFSGMVQIFKKEPGIWSQFGSILYGRDAGDYFGHVVSLSNDGNYLGITSLPVIGPQEQVSKFGYALVYENKSNDWMFKAEVDGGIDISLSNNGSRVGVNTNQTAQLYDLGASGLIKIGEEFENIIPDNLMRGSVSGDGNTAAVGHYVLNQSLPIPFTREVHVYRYDAENDWMNMIGEPIKGSIIDETYGSELSLSYDGSIIAIGGTNIAQVFKYMKDDNIWEQIGTDIVGKSDNSIYNVFRVSLSDAGDRIIVGSPLYETFIGRAMIFEFHNNDWVQIGGDIKPNFLAGTSVSISSEGSHFAVGCPGASSNGRSGNGCVYVYHIVQN